MMTATLTELNDLILAFSDSQPNVVIKSFMQEPHISNDTKYSRHILFDGYLREIIDSINESTRIPMDIIELCYLFFFKNPQIGNKVLLINNHIGQVLWIGKVHESDGKQYYGIGFLCPLSMEQATKYVTEWYEDGYNDINLHQVIDEGFKSRFIISSNAMLHNYGKYAPGDRLKLLNGETGTVRYHGYIREISGAEIIGIELDFYSPNAGDGSINDTAYFETEMGRGYFACHQEVQNILVARIVEGSYARLKGLQRVPKYNGKTVKIISWHHDKERWKVKLLHARQEKKYLGVAEENLDPILNWEPLHYHSSFLFAEPNIGDRVKTRQGKYGIVKFIGDVEFGDCKRWIGLELDEFDLNGHNGTIKGVQYFTAPEGKGYFVKQGNLLENCT